MEVQGNSDQTRLEWTATQVAHENFEQVLREFVPSELKRENF